jgi:hypothetical protein
MKIMILTMMMINGIDFDRYSHGDTEMGRKPTYWALDLRDYHTMDGGRYTWIISGDTIRFHTIISYLDTIPYTLDDWNLDDDIMLGFGIDDRVCFHLDTSDDLRCGITHFHHACTLDNDALPWRGHPILFEA